MTTQSNLAMSSISVHLAAYVVAEFLENGAFSKLLTFFLRLNAIKINLESPQVRSFH